MTAHLATPAILEDLDQWHFEGPDGVTTPEPGVLRLACEGSKQGGAGVMAFCKVDFPDNIAIEYDLFVETTYGLFITFVALQGINSEDAITGVPPRTGVFKDYVGDDASTRSYHVSVCRYNNKGVHTGVSNWRRNPGIHMMTSGTDLCTEAGRTYHVTITKRAATVVLLWTAWLGPSSPIPERCPDPFRRRARLASGPSAPRLSSASPISR